MAYKLEDLTKGSPRLRGEIDPATAVPAPELTRKHAAELRRQVEESESMLLEDDLDARLARAGRRQR